MFSELISDLQETARLQASLEAYTQDYHNLILYQTSVGTGLEAFNTPAGTLIQTGLATKYPEHFQTGTGLEGLTSLIKELKEGINGLKKTLTGRKGFIKQVGERTLGKIKKTYGNKQWVGDNTYVTGVVSVQALAPLGAKNTLTDVTRAANTIAGDYSKTTGKTADDVKQYVNKARVFLKRMKQCKTKEELKTISDELVKALPLPKQAIDYTVPTLKLSSGATEYPSLTGDEVVVLSRVMSACVQQAIDIENRVEELYNSPYAMEEELTDWLPETIPVEAVKELLHRLNYTAVIDPLFTQAEGTCSRIVTLCQAIEQWIVASIK